MRKTIQTVRILLVEDNPGDVRLTQEVLKDGKYQYDLEVVTDGEEALEYLLKRGDKYATATTPDIIFLDLNLPRKDGREVLGEIKSHEKIKHIPVVVLTTSEAGPDIMHSYQLHANCYITKPVDINRFNEVIRGIENFWFNIVTLPSYNP
ncbi:MAG: response regulator [Bacteroidia bacterium]|nr:response regulator [Bacteroidia bacterium]